MVDSADVDFSQSQSRPRETGRARAAEDSGLPRDADDTAETAPDRPDAKKKKSIMSRSWQSDALSVAMGFKHGVVYGAKVRAPHALVMTFLFRSGTLTSKLRAVVKATYTHSKNLGTFVALYKAACAVLRRARGGKDDGLTSFVAGAAAAFIVWGDESPVNSQINMYILSRIMWGSARTALRKGWVPEVPGAYQIYASLCWGLVMYLFHHQHGTLQPSLISSMKYLYVDSEPGPE